MNGIDCLQRDYTKVRKGLLFLRKGLTLSVIGVKYGDNFTISILKMLLMVQSIKITLTCFYLSLLN